MTKLNTVEKLYSSAVEAFNNQRLVWAETLVTAALLFNPDDRDCLELKADILYCTDRDSEACEFYQRALHG